MSHIRKILIAAALTVTVAPASAETWTLASTYPESTFHTQNLHWFAEEVAKATNGELTIEVHSGASLFPMAQVKRAMRTGQVQMGEFILSAYGNEYPIYEADSLPYLARSDEELMKLYELQYPLIEQRMDSEGLVPLYTVPWPINGIFSNKPLDTPDDFKGLRMRGQTAIVAQFVRNVGADPVDVQLVEMPQAFQTGVVQGMFTAASNGVNAQTWDYADYYYDTPFVRPRNMVAVNKEAWEKLPEETRAKVLDVAAEAGKRGLEISNNLDAESKVTLAEHGTTVAKLSPEVEAYLQEAGAKIVEEWQQRAGPEGQGLVAALQASRQ